MRKIPTDMLTGSMHQSNKCGDFIILNYYNKTKVSIKFISTKTVYTVRSAQIRTGAIKDFMLPSILNIGYIGIGPYPTKIKNKATKAYTTWMGMFTRCYSQASLKTNPTYYDCTVCEEWYNFQNFAAWFNTKYIEGFALDKDIKIKGNRVYSPRTCIFTSLALNTIEACAKHFIFVSPTNAVVKIYNLSQFCRENHLCISSMNALYHGRRLEYNQWRKYEL